MKKIILSNWRFKLISLLVGFVIWILLVNISNPEVVRTKTVPLTVLNESVLTRAGKTYTLPQFRQRHGELSGENQRCL